MLFYLFAVLLWDLQNFFDCLLPQIGNNFLLVKIMRKFLLIFADKFYFTLPKIFIVDDKISIAAIHSLRNFISNIMNSMYREHKWTPKFS
jgi:hypothetical protein